MDGITPQEHDVSSAVSGEQRANAASFRALADRLRKRDADPAVVSDIPSITPPPAAAPLAAPTAIVAPEIPVMASQPVAPQLDPQPVAPPLQPPIPEPVATEPPVYPPVEPTAAPPTEFATTIAAHGPVVAEQPAVEPLPEAVAEPTVQPAAEVSAEQPPAAPIVEESAQPAEETPIGAEPEAPAPGPEMPASAAVPEPTSQSAESSSLLSDNLQPKVALPDILGPVVDDIAPIPSPVRQTKPEEQPVPQPVVQEDTASSGLLADFASQFGSPQSIASVPASVSQRIEQEPSAPVENTFVEPGSEPVAPTPLEPEPAAAAEETPPAAATTDVAEEPEVAAEPEPVIEQEPAKEPEVPQPASFSPNSSEHGIGAETPTEVDPAPEPVSEPKPALAVEDIVNSLRAKFRQPEAEGATSEEAGTEAETPADTKETGGDVAVENAPEAANETSQTSDAKRAVEAPAAEDDIDYQEYWNQEKSNDAAETAKTLLDIMFMPSGAAQPQEKSLAADTLLRVVNRVPRHALPGVAEKIAMMEQPPVLLVRRLINHPEIDVAGLVLENCQALNDQDIQQIIAQGDSEKMRLIARRRKISQAVCDDLIEKGDSSVHLTVVRNPGAQISHDSFVVLAREAETAAALQAPMATRGDTPAPIAFELFWYLPTELRRYVVSRFLTDSATLDRILKITLAVDVDDNDELKFPGAGKIEELVSQIADGDHRAAAPPIGRSDGHLHGKCRAHYQRY